MSGRRRRRTGRVVVAAGAVVVAGAVAATGLGLGLPGGDTPSEASSDLPPATAEVTRQTLVDTQSESGELGYGTTTSASARSGGTVTGLPATGSAVKRGQALYRLDNAPVVLLYGSLPAYRTLGVGTEGADVTQFEKNLRALGYDGFTVDDEYSSATASAVKEWQEDLGLPETGSVELGRVVFAAGEVRVDSHDAEVGEAVQPGTAVVSYTGTARVVTVELEVSDQRLARKGAPVAVTLPDGKQTRGRIARTELVIQPAEGQEPASTTVEVTVSVDDAKSVAGLDQATVDVAFTASERENVLTVPVAALLALAEGGYGVQVFDGTATRIVAVETGMFATGRVEISGDGIAEGMAVGMPS
ncbi:peptidoglycan-binding protein [Phytohabitans houttuyneae]|uniref:efflux RND transporter periplasmic adaptor subunit n=1 Tax=Phytohabitans houttuyneae TaxID=1076126 RepID=UPI0031E86254